MSESKTAVSLMSANVNVGINEVVSVFVSRYETDLFNRKDDISDRIKGLKAEQDKLTKRLTGSVDKGQYERTVAVLNISSKVGDIRVDFEGKSPSIQVVIEIKDDDKNDGYSRSINKTIRLPLEEKDVDLYNNIKSQLESLNAELLEVMNLIKTVSRKERQIRGRISEMKLEQSGFSDLLQSPEMLQLISINK